MGIEEFLLDRAEKRGIEKGIKKGIERGFEKGIEQSVIKVVKSLLRETDFDDEKIASLVGISPELVKKIKMEN